MSRVPASPTSLGTFLTCPRQFQAKYITKEVVFQPTEASLFGDRGHKGLGSTCANDKVETFQMLRQVGSEASHGAPVNVQPKWSKGRYVPVTGCSFASTTRRPGVASMRPMRVTGVPAARPASSTASRALGGAVKSNS